MSPASGHASLNAGDPSRSCRPRCAMRPASAPEGAAMLAALSRGHIATAGPLGSDPAQGTRAARHDVRERR